MVIGLCLLVALFLVARLFGTSASYRRNFEDPYTVAYDYSIFYGHSHNQRQQLEQVQGRAAAYDFGKKWIREHPSGAFTILEGHHAWPSEVE